ncbi:hypothetical protein ACJJTC_000253 [Scirpophaga incertulas]
MAKQTLHVAIMNIKFHPSVVEKANASEVLNLKIFIDELSRKCSIAWSLVQWPNGGKEWKNEHLKNISTPPQRVQHRRLLQFSPRVASNEYFGGVGGVAAHVARLAVEGTRRSVHAPLASGLGAADGKK